MEGICQKFGMGFVKCKGGGICGDIQLTASSRRENGGAYGGDVFGGKWVVSRGDLSNYLFCVVVWSVLVNDEFLVQLEKSTPPPLFPRRQSARY